MPNPHYHECPLQSQYQVPVGSPYQLNFHHPRHNQHGVFVGQGFATFFKTHHGIVVTSSDIWQISDKLSLLFTIVYKASRYSFGPSPDIFGLYSELPLSFATQANAISPLQLHMFLCIFSEMFSKFCNTFSVLLLIVPFSLRYLKNLCYNGTFST